MPWQGSGLWSIANHGMLLIHGFLLQRLFAIFLYGFFK